MRRLPFLVALAATIVIAGCGGDDDDGTGADAARSDSSVNVTDQLFAGSATANLRDPAQGKKGGKLTVLASGDVDFLDPGKTYYVYTIGILNAMHRGLYAYLPNDVSKPVPDLASADPEITPDGKTVTVKLRKGVMFSDPVNREVTSADVEVRDRAGVHSNVSNGYVQTYFGDVVGAPKAPGPYKEVPASRPRTTPRSSSNWSKGTGAALAGALAMPISIPGAEGLRAEVRQAVAVDVRRAHAVYTGPYKVEGDAQGDVTGYKPGQSIHVVRNRSTRTSAIPPRVPGRTRVPGRQRRHLRRDEADPERRELGVGNFPPPAR